VTGTEPNRVFTKAYSYTVTEQLPAGADPVTALEQAADKAIRNNIEYDIEPKAVTVTVTYNESTGSIEATADPANLTVSVTNEQLGSLQVTKTVKLNGSNYTDHGTLTFYVGLFDNDTGKAVADVITLASEVIDDTKPYEIFDPRHTWKRKTVTNFTAVKLQKRIFKKGECVYNAPSVSDIQKYCKEQVSTMWDEVLRFENPHEYYVDLSQELWDLRSNLLSTHSK